MLAAPRAEKLTTTIPTPTTPLVGREDDLASVVALLQQVDVHFVSLLGTGGVGKTRLALAAAMAVCDQFTQVHVVSLTTISVPELVVPTIAQALNVRESVTHTAWQVLALALRDTAALLVLDDVEQVLPVMPLLADLLIACPRLKLMTTSRSALRLRGTHEVLVKPLTLPAAMTLLVQRVWAVQPTFVLSARNKSEIAALCTRLGRLPLALELAAPRLKLLAPSALLARLDGTIFTPLDVLASGAREQPVRQQSLRATIAWSYELLDAAEQRLFARLAVFSGGWTLEAAKTICGIGLKADVRHPQRLLSDIETLINNGLLVRQGSDAGPRFSMLEPLHDYAREQLIASNELAAMQQRHASYYAAFAQHAEAGLCGPRQSIWMSRLEREQPNLQAALQWAFQAEATNTERLTIGLRLATTLGIFWVRRGQLAEACRGLNQALVRAGTLQSSAAARALLAAISPATTQGDDVGLRESFTFGASG